MLKIKKSLRDPVDSRRHCDSRVCAQDLIFCNDSGWKKNNNLVQNIIIKSILINQSLGHQLRMLVENKESVDPSLRS